MLLCVRTQAQAYTHIKAWGWVTGRSQEADRCPWSSADISQSFHLVRWHHSRALCSPVYNPSEGQEVAQDFLASLVSTKWLGRLKAGSSLFRSGVRGQTSWLHHLGQNPKTHTHAKTFSGLPGNTQSHIHSKYLVKAAVLPHTTNANHHVLRKQWGWEGARLHSSPRHGNASICPRSIPKHWSEISSCQSARRRDGETREKKGEDETSPLVHVRCAWLFWWKTPGFHRFYWFLLQCRHLLAIL